MVPSHEQYNTVLIVCFVDCRHHQFPKQMTVLFKIQRKQNGSLDIAPEKSFRLFVKGRKVYFIVFDNTHYLYYDFTDPINYFKIKIWILNVQTKQSTGVF